MDSTADFLGLERLISLSVATTSDVNSRPSSGEEPAGQLFSLWLILFREMSMTLVRSLSVVTAYVSIMFFAAIVLGMF